MNILRVSYIDPSFDRCCAALEWMSSTDTYRSNQQLSSSDGYYVESIHTPTVAAAVHILCRVEQPQGLVFSIRELTDSQYQMEFNKALIQKFLDGLSLLAKSTRTGLCRVAIETLPYTLWILSAGQGSSALSRSVTSSDLLNKGESEALGRHADILRTLGLKYITLDKENDQERGQSHYQNSATPKVRFDPPIERLIKFVDISNDRLDIPPAVRPIVMCECYIYIF
jgi:chromosome transmission fidelity protein 18